MKKPVVDIPLLKDKVLINIEQPCYYCGKPIPDGTEKWQRKITYQMKYWGLTKQNRNWALGDLIDESGNKKLGEVVLNISYCPEHVPVPPVIKNIRALRKVFIILLSIIFLGGFLWFFLVNDSTKYLGEDQLLYLIIFPPVVIFIGWLLASLIAEFTKWWISRSQITLKDFELNGHWGIHSFYTEINQGEVAKGPITYQLKITCSNSTLAQRFKDAYPYVNVT